MKKLLPFSLTDVLVLSKLLRFADTGKVVSKHKKPLLKNFISIVLVESTLVHIYNIL